MDSYRRPRLPLIILASLRALYCVVPLIQKDLSEQALARQPVIQNE